MTLLAYTLLAFSSLFAIVDPIATVPAFVAMTATDTARAKVRTARLACLVAAGVLMLFAGAGKWIFRVLGITLPAFQLAGSILMLRIALDMLYAKRSAAQETHEEVEAGVAKDDIAITPLGVPMLAGPGAISTSLILLSQAHGVAQVAMLFVAIAVVCLATYVVFWLAAKGTARISPLALKLVTRLMGLLLAAVAVQFVINALTQLGIISHV
ncbi:MAG: antibiotic resistance protein MarC [Verrucomicrobia bacterium]|nr:MAG: antibiotic resistance protein MarC [Verrucomicrobiota bacterium]